MFGELLNSKAAGLLTWAVLVRLLWGCAADDAQSPSLQAQAQGRWQAEHVFLNGQEDTLTDYAGFRLELRPDGSFFWEDPSGNTTDETRQLAGTWQVDEAQRLLLLNGQQRVLFVALANGQRLQVDFELSGFKDEVADVSLWLRRVE